jgi:GTPase Era involved in 16S rRNA processing
MINVNNKSVIDDDGRFLIFECKIDDHIPVDFIKNKSNYNQIENKSRNAFSFEIKEVPEMESLTNSFSDENLYKIIDELYESNKFWFAMSWVFNRKKYGSMYEFLKDNTFIAKTIFMDTPGWHLPAHFDNRLTFGNLIINLDDNPISTKFHDYRNNNELIYQSPKEKGTGVIFFNTENSCHSYINDTNQNRYVLLIAIILKPGFFTEVD